MLEENILFEKKLERERKKIYERDLKKALKASKKKEDLINQYPFLNNNDYLLELEEENKKDKSKCELNVSIDCEYRDDEYLSLQICIKCVHTSLDDTQRFLEKNFVLVEEKYVNDFSKYVLEMFSKENPNSEVIFRPLNALIDLDKESILLGVLTNFLYKNDILAFGNSVPSESEYIDCEKSLKAFKGQNVIILNLFFFYTPRDLICAFGKNIMGNFFLGNYGSLRNKNNIVGSFYIGHECRNHKTYVKEKYKFRVILKDLCKIDVGNLKRICQSCSIDISKKKSLDSYKENMVLAIKEKPLDFLNYGLFDAACLHLILERKISNFNLILSNFGIQDDHFTARSFPLTIGSAVSSLWKKFFKHKIWDKKKLYPIVQSLHSTLNIDYIYHQDMVSTIELVRKNYKSYSELENFTDNNREEYFNLVKNLSIKKGIKYNLSEKAGVEYLASNFPNTTIPILSLVNGGRAINERPLEYFSKYIADVDISGAYGNILESSNYPIGRARLYGTTSNQKKITLKTFLKVNEKHLGKFYNIVVSGKLDFSQDLIFSKLIDKQKIYENIFRFLSVEGKGKMNAPFTMIRNELKNGLITPSVLEILKKVCSNKELKSIYNLEVEAALFYSPLDQCSSVEDLLDKLLKDKKRDKFTDKGNVEDERTHAWFAFPLTDFIGKLVRERKKIKEQIKKCTDPTEKENLVGYQEALKLVINTFWGDITSLYFEMSQSCLSNIVSADTRCNVWLMAKALGSFLSITDGGPMSLQGVNFFKPNLKEKKKPSMDILSEYYKLVKHPSIEVKPLAGINWKAIFEEGKSPKDDVFSNLDSMITEHVKNFWSIYNIDINFKMEHKIENTAYALSYGKKVHYCILRHEDFNDLNDSFPIDRELFPMAKEGACALFKVRGSGIRINKEGNSPFDLSNPMFKLLASNLYQVDNFKFNREYYEISLLKITSWKKSLKDPEDFMSSKFGLGVFPGDVVKVKKIFRYNNDFAYCYTIDEYKRRRSRSDRKSLELFEKYFPLKGIQKTYEENIAKNILRGCYKKIIYENFDSEREIKVFKDQWYQNDSFVDFDLEENFNEFGENFNEFEEDFNDFVDTDMPSDSNFDSTY